MIHQVTKFNYCFYRHFYESGDKKTYLFNILFLEYEL